MKLFFTINESWGINLKRIALLAVLCCGGICGFSQGWMLEVEVDLNHVDCAIERLQYASASFNGFSSSSSGPFTGSRTILTIIGSGSTAGTLSVTANGSCDEVYYPEIPVSTINSSYFGTWNFAITCVTNTNYSSSSSNQNGVFGG